MRILRIARKLTLAALVLTVIFLSSCAWSLSVDLASVEKVTVSSGAGGHIEITEPSVIEQITEKLTAVKYSDGRKNDVDGFSYVIVWWSGEGKMVDSIAILGKYQAVYDGFIFDTVGGEIDVSYFDALLKEA